MDMKKHYISFRGAVGSLLYRIIYLALLYLGIKFFGSSIFDGVILAILGFISFELIGIILRGMGFWKY